MHLVSTNNQPADGPPALRMYCERFGARPPMIDAPPARGLRLVVVIPCFQEPDLASALEALWRCERPVSPVEVITVINHSAQAPPEVVSHNLRTLHEAQLWASTKNDERFRFHFLFCPDLPPKHAGVGLARKIGMDEALHRFARGGAGEGIILCFDADCVCARNYLAAVEAHFQSLPETPGCSIYFEHPLAGPLAPEVYEAAAAYELSLRYYVQALQWAGSPYAYHTIGSSMAVRSEVYRQQGGMNKRKAGEDFYFLQKIIALGHFSNLNSTTVYPSPRPSRRVPFGTGRAVCEYLDQPPDRKQKLTYPLEAFLDLRTLFEAIPDFQSSTRFHLDFLPRPIQEFLQAHQFQAALTELRANSSSLQTFQKRFFRWFNAFMVMKFVHFARDQFYGENEVAAEASRLEALMSGAVAGKKSVEMLLHYFRDLDRASAGPPA